MNRKNFGIGLLLLTTIAVLAGIPGAMAQSQYAAALQTNYGISSCSTCHVDFNSPPTLTTYGNLFSSVSTHSSDPSGALCSIGAPPGATTNNCPAPADTTPPVITVTGTNPVNINVGDTYVDAGATATDNVDPVVTVVTSGSVNTAVAGTYTLTYNAQDAAGNAAIPKTRTVNVNAIIPPPDTTPPVITVTGTNPVNINVGDTYVDAGATATDNVDPVVTVVTSGSVNTAVAGIYTLTYNAQDAAGNAAIPKTRTVNVNAIIPPPDTTPPVITVTGTNPVNINVGATYVDAGATAVDAVDGNVAVTTTGSVNTNVVGTYTITYTATDKSGNSATATRTVNVAASPPVTSPPTDREYDDESDHEYNHEYDHEEEDD